MSGILCSFVGAAGGTPPGQQAYTTAGTYTWVAPPGVTSVSVVAVGPGGGLLATTTAGTSCAGGGLGYKNAYSVTPGSSYTVVVGGPSSGVDSYFVSTAVVKGGAASTSGNTPGTYAGDGGGNGGSAGITGGGGAGLPRHRPRSGGGGDGRRRA